MGLVRQRMRNPDEDVASLVRQARETGSLSDAQRAHAALRRIAGATVPPGQEPLWISLYETVATQEIHHEGRATLKRPRSFEWGRLAVEIGETSMGSVFDLASDGVLVPMIPLVHIRTLGGSRSYDRPDGERFLAANLNYLGFSWRLSRDKPRYGDSPNNYTLWRKKPRAAVFHATTFRYWEREEVSETGQRQLADSGVGFADIADTAYTCELDGHARSAIEASMRDAFEAGWIGSDEE